MRKIVRYNGRRKSGEYVDPTRPTRLVIGELYTVIDEIRKPQKTEYLLKDMVGKFDSSWFDDVNTYVAITNAIPKVGKRCECLSVKFDGGFPTLEDTRTSVVQEVEDLGNNVYRVFTLNSIYVMQLG